MFFFSIFSREFSDWRNENLQSGNNILRIRRFLSTRVWHIITHMMTNDSRQNRIKYKIKSLKCQWFISNFKKIDNTTQHSSERSWIMFWKLQEILDGIFIKDFINKHHIISVQSRFKIVTVLFSIVENIIKIIFKGGLWCLCCWVCRKFKWRF